MDLKKAYDKKALLQVLRMHDVGGELLNLACVRVKGGEREYFRIISSVRQGCIMSPWLFNIYGWMQ